MRALVVVGLALFVPQTEAFQPFSWQRRHRPFTSPSARGRRRGTRLFQSSSSDPQVFGTGYSPKLDLFEAIQEATENAIHALPKPTSLDAKIDLAIVTISSLYDGQSSPSIVVPTVLSSGSTYGKGVMNLVGCTSGGIISSVANYDMISEVDLDESEEEDEEAKKNLRACLPVESEGVPGVSVTLCILPDVQVKTFHVLGDDVPDDVGRVAPETWKNAVGLRGFGTNQDEDGDAPAFMLIPSPAFQNDLDDFLGGLKYSFPSGIAFGGIASTVSSLSRARLFRYDESDTQCIQTLADGCIGVALQGDVEVKTMVAQGAKPVGGVYRIVQGQDSTINLIALDEAATEEAQTDQLEEEDDDDKDKDDAKAQAAAAYAKAIIPKPVLAEANYVMKTLSDDDQSFMRKALLVGLERGGTLGRTPNELKRLAEGRGHRFTVHQVASAGMKDGSVTLPLGSVDVQPGTRLRFFVREGDFAKREVDALWMGYKKKTLEETFATTKDGGMAPLFNPSGCFILSTLDRGTKLFGGKPGYESEMTATFLPTIPAVSGIFSNGILGRLDETEAGGMDTMVHGSAAEYVLIGSKSRRPVYCPAKAAAEEAAADKKKAEQYAAEKAAAAEDERRKQRARSPLELDQRAPRSPDGELIIKRREVHSGRAMTVSTVEWSVAEKTATPTSVLEGFMWDKETEVDRLRERVPLSNLVSQCRLFAADPSKPKPRDWIGVVKGAGADGRFVVVPECKRMEPVSGSLRKRYDLAKLVKQMTFACAPAFSINCDGVLFGGSLEDVTKAREASSSAAIELSTSNDDGIVVPPILASDLILYPYQLYKLRLAGADAVNLVGGALASKDLLYLTKIASSLQLQVMATATSEAQIRALTSLQPGSISALIVSNRELEDFSFDMTGEQALGLLNSDALQEFYDKHGDDVPVLVEGRVGIIERIDATGTSSTVQYVKELKEAGAFGAIIGGGLATTGEDDTAQSFENLLSDYS